MAEEFSLGVSMPVRSIKECIGKRRSDGDRLERVERSALLEEHQKKWTAFRLTLAKECKQQGGHEWIDLPHNGVNRPHFITGEWPQRCKWCRITKRAADNQRGEHG